MLRESAGSLASQWPPSDPAGSSLDAAVRWFLPSPRRRAGSRARVPGGRRCADGPARSTLLLSGAERRCEPSGKLEGERSDSDGPCVPKQPHTPRTVMHRGSASDVTESCSEWPRPNWSSTQYALDFWRPSSPPRLPKPLDGGVAIASRRSDSVSVLRRLTALHVHSARRCR
jgi:hypothetical protein